MVARETKKCECDGSGVVIREVSTWGIMFMPCSCKGEKNGQRVAN